MTKVNFEDNSSKHKGSISPSIFRTYDIRGIYSDDLNERVAYRIARAFMFLYPDVSDVVVGRDTRNSSPSLSEAVIKAICDAGKNVIKIGIAPDSLFYFSIFNQGFQAGITVTGSHNPKQYNGLTLHAKKRGQAISQDVVGEDLERIKEVVLSDRQFHTKAPRGKVTDFDPSPKYIKYIVKRINLTRPLSIIVDSGNGACGYLPEKVFTALGCQVKTLYGQFDGNFPHHLPDPYVEESLKEIKKQVLSHKADLGFAYDGDGDRVAPIDNRGRMVNGDFSLLLLARQALDKKKGPIVHDMRVSKAFLDEMKKRQVKTYFTVSHHNAVINKIIETGAVFGGEITLHFLFPLDYYLCDDALFASLKLAEVASAQRDFAEYVDSLPRYYASPELFIESTDEEKFKLIANLQKYLREHHYNFIDVDGARINFEHGWALARASNTSPLIKCRFEGETKQYLEGVRTKAIKIFKRVGIPISERLRD